METKELVSRNYFRSQIYVWHDWFMHHPVFYIWYSHRVLTSREEYERSVNISSEGKAGAERDPVPSPRQL